MWNFLPEYVVNAPSVDSFKNRLDKQWSNEEIVYDYWLPSKAKITLANLAKMKKFPLAKSIFL